MFGTIVLAVDESKQARRAIDTAHDLAKVTGDEVVVVHCREFVVAGRAGTFATEEYPDASDLVNGVVEELTKDGIRARGEVRRALSGRIGRDIVSAARQYVAGLVVLGSRGTSDMRSLLIGSVAHEVVHLSPCPVLLVHTGD